MVGKYDLSPEYPLQRHKYRKRDLFYRQISIRNMLYKIIPETSSPYQTTASTAIGDAFRHNNSEYYQINHQLNKRCVYISRLTDIPHKTKTWISSRYETQYETHSYLVRALVSKRKEKKKKGISSSRVSEVRQVQGYATLKCQILPRSLYQKLTLLTKSVVESVSRNYAL